MSLILDALKKAERQHKMGDVPGIGSVYLDDTPQGSNLLGITLLAVVAITMLTLGLYLGDEDTIEQATKQEELSIDLPAPASMQDLDESTVAGQPAVDSMPVTLKQETIQPLVQVPEPERIEPAVELPVAKVAKPAVKPKVKQRPPETKHLNELPDGFVDNLPSLNIDIHSYDKQPGRSYVLINMEKYREGDYLTEGPLLSEIVSDGVVLEHMGERFILPIGNHN